MTYPTVLEAIDTYRSAVVSDLRRLKDTLYANLMNVDNIAVMRQGTPYVFDCSGYYRDSVDRVVNQLVATGQYLVTVDPDYATMSIEYEPTVLADVLASFGAS